MVSASPALIPAAELRPAAPDASTSVTVSPVRVRARTSFAGMCCPENAALILAVLGANVGTMNTGLPQGSSSHAG